MKRCLPLAVSILANLGGGAAGTGIAYLLGAYLLGPTLPAFGGVARPLDPSFLQPFLLGWAVPSVLFPLLVGPYYVYRRFGLAGEEEP